MPRALPAAAPRDRILDAADRLLARYGYRKMTVDDIAQEAGIGKGTVYLSFPAKEEIALCCIDRMVDRLIDRLRAIASGAGTVESRLHSMLRERVLHRFDYARDHAASIDAMLGAVRPALLARRAKYFRGEAVVFEAVLAEARRDRDTVAASKAADAEALVTATNALLPYSLSPRELGNRRDLERRVDAVADLLVRGLHPSASGRPSRHRRSPRRSLS
jgi:AcrR family transcriptional regulator